MKYLREYLLRNWCGAVVFRGTVKECAGFLEVSDTAFYAVIRKGRTEYRGYRIEEAETASEWTQEDWRVIGNWNKFTAPLRRKFGIDVKRGGTT